MTDSDHLDPPPSAPQPALVRCPFCEVLLPVPVWWTPASLQLNLQLTGDGAAAARHIVDAHVATNPTSQEKP